MRIHNGMKKLLLPFIIIISFACEEEQTMSDQLAQGYTEVYVNGKGTMLVESDSTGYAGLKFNYGAEFNRVLWGQGLNDFEITVVGEEGSEVSLKVLSDDKEVYMASGDSLYYKPL